MNSVESITKNYIINRASYKLAVYKGHINSKIKSNHQALETMIAKGLKDLGYNHNKSCIEYEKMSNKYSELKSIFKCTRKDKQMVLKSTPELYRRVMITRYTRLVDSLYT